MCSRQRRTAPRRRRFEVMTARASMARISPPVVQRLVRFGACPRAATRASPPQAPRLRPSPAGGGRPRARTRRTGRGSTPRPRDRPAARPAALELFDRDRPRARDVAGLVLLGGADVDEHDVALAQACDQLVAADRVDVVAEVVACGALDLGQARDRDVAQREPQREHLVAGERVAHARALARARDHAGGVQRLQVLRGVRGRLLARARELVDRARRLCEQVEQLQPARAGERLAHQRDRLEEGVLLATGTHPLLFNRSLDSLSSLTSSNPWRPTCTSGSC